LPRIVVDAFFPQGEVAMSTFGRSQLQNRKRLARGRFTPRLEPLEARSLPSVINNVLVNNVAHDTTAQDTQSETTITLGTANNVVVGFNDSGEDTTNQHFTGWSSSSNGGAAWTDHGALPTSTNGDVGDPVMSTNATNGNIYFATLSFNASNTLEFYTSTDQGNSFGTPVNPAPGTASSSLLDKEWQTVDNFSGSGQGNIYLSYTNFGSFGFGPSNIKFTRSTDGGVTWGPSGGLTINPSRHTVQGSNVVVGPDHSVYVFYLDGTTFNAQKIMVAKSTNQGVSFGTPTVVANLSVTGVNGDLGLNGGFRTNSFPHVAVNPVSGNIYVVYNDTGTAVGDAADVFFTQSTDGGATWSSRVKLNNDTTTHDQWQPDIAVTPDGTKVFMGWYDRRLDPANLSIDWEGTIGDISGSTITFRGNGRITTGSFPVVHGQDPVVNTTYMGDYDTAVASNTFFYTTWGDNRLADSSHTHNPDVRITVVPVNYGHKAGIAGAFFGNSGTDNESTGLGSAFAPAIHSAWQSPLTQASGLSSSVAAAFSNDNSGAVTLQYNAAVNTQSQDAQVNLLDLYYQSEFQKAHGQS
jgi:hypothetical protein